MSNWTDADGVFRLKPYPGAYKLKFVVPSGTGLDQWLGGTESEAATRPLQVTAGQTVTLDERQLPTGMVRGRLLDGAGQPPERVGSSSTTPPAGGGSRPRPRLRVTTGRLTALHARL